MFAPQPHDWPVLPAKPLSMVLGLKIQKPGWNAPAFVPCQVASKLSYQL